jgi:ribosome-associated heat shock protein Hsp15
LATRAENVVSQSVKEPVSEVRVDKWLWCVRVFKTRSEATAACRGHRVHIAGDAVRPARTVRVGETVAVSLGHWTRSLRVVALLDHRVGAALVADYAADVTPAEERARAEERSLLHRLAGQTAGDGRPTKRDRRDWEKAFRQAGW